MTALPAESDDRSYDDQPGPGGPVPAPLTSAGPPARARRHGLRVVPARRRRRAPLAPFVVVVAGLLLLGLAALLGLNTVLAQDAFRLHDLEQANTRLGEREQALQRQLTRAQSPATLADRAGDLGMLPSSAPLFLRLPDGAVLGAAPEGGAGSADPDALAAVQAAAEAGAAGGATEAPGSGEEPESSEATGSSEEPESSEATGSGEEPESSEAAGSSEEPESSETTESGADSSTAEQDGQAAEDTAEPVEETP